MILKDECLKFSHQIPCFHLTNGKGASFEVVSSSILTQCMRGFSPLIQCEITLFMVNLLEASFGGGTTSLQDGRFCIS